MNSLQKRTGGLRQLPPRPADDFAGAEPAYCCPTTPAMLQEAQQARKISQAAPAAERNGV